MKNKKTTYLLAAVVLLVWGLVIYKLFFGNSAKEDYAYVPVRQNVANMELDVTEKFTLMADYRDPFLGKVKSKKKYNGNSATGGSTIVKARPKKKEEEEELKVIIQWPSIQYKGLINSKAKSVGLLVYNGGDRIVMPGDSLDGLYIEMLDKDSIRINNQGQVKAYY